MDDISLSVLFGFLLLFIALSAFFSGSETGLMTANRYRLRHQAKTGNPRAKRILSMLAEPDKLIGTLLIGNTTVNILASAIATLIGLRIAGDSGVAIATGALTFVLLIFGEVGPKTVAARHPDRVAMLASFVLPSLQRLMSPLVYAVNLTANVFFRFKRLAQGELHLNRDELQSLVQDVFIPKQHRSMLLGVLELDRITVNDIMVPRGEVQGINIDDDIDDIQTQLRRTQHTRLPVFRGELNDCIGMLHIRNSTRFLGKAGLTKAEILQYVREPYFVPEGTTLPAQLVQFQKLKRRFGLVVDEYGDVQGIVTLEAILEEIVGEFTTKMSGHHKDIIPQPDGTWLIEGSTAIRDINRQLHWQLPIDGPRTLNGLLIDTLETIPESALCLRIGDYRFETLQIKDNTIKAVRALSPAPLAAHKHT